MQSSIEQAVDLFFDAHDLRENAPNIFYHYETDHLDCKSSNSNIKRKRKGDQTRAICERTHICEGNVIHAFGSVIDLCRLYCKEPIEDVIAHPQIYDNTMLLTQGLEEEFPSWSVLWSTCEHIIGDIYVDRCSACPHAQQSVMLGRDVLFAEIHYNRAIALWPENSQALMGLGSIYRDYGHIELAASIYSRVVKLADPKIQQEDTNDVLDSWILAPRRRAKPVAAYLLAILYSQLGRYDDAKECITCFEYSYRLSNNVWEATKGQDKIELIPLILNTNFAVTMQPNIFQKHPLLYQTLLNAFKPGANYWKETDYSSANREYFSFWCPINSNFDINTIHSPMNSIECLIHLLLPLVKDRVPGVFGAEWWAHTRPVGRDLGHNFHFDMEEALLEATGSIYHPALSSIVYMSGSESRRCGPTLVLHQGIDSTSFAEDGFLIHPRDQEFCTFPGWALHGALPIEDPAAQDDVKNVCHRLVILISWWSDRRVRQCKGVNRRRLSPQSPLPHVTRKVTWPNSLEYHVANERWDIDSVSSMTNNVYPTHSSIQYVKPVWESMKRMRPPIYESSVISSMDQRFFAVSPTSFKTATEVEHWGGKPVQVVSGGQYSSK